MTSTNDEEFEVRIVKRSGDEFSIDVQVGAGELTARDAALEAIQLLVVHLENQCGRQGWDDGIQEGRRSASVAE